MQIVSSSFPEAAKGKPSTFNVKGVPLMLFKNFLKNSGVIIFFSYLKKSNEAPSPFCTASATFLFSK